MTASCSPSAHASCCKGGRPGGRLARFSGTVGSVIPGALLLLLPKCPLCLATWLTAATGFGVSAAIVAQARWLIVGLWIAASALAAVQILRRRSPAS